MSNFHEKWKVNQLWALYWSGLKAQNLDICINRLSPVKPESASKSWMVLLVFQYAHDDYLGFDLPSLLAKSTLSPVLTNFDHQHTDTGQ